MEWLTLENVPAEDLPLCLGISVLAFLVIWALVAIRERRKKRNSAIRRDLEINIKLR
jgi:hypothetical protein